MTKLMDQLSHFETWFLENGSKIGSGHFLEFSHMKEHSGGVVFGEGWHLGATCRRQDIMYKVCRGNHMFVCSPLTPVLTLIAKSSRISLSLFPC